jgi:hypothetical protein
MYRMIFDPLQNVALLPPRLNGYEHFHLHPFSKRIAGNSKDLTLTLCHAMAIQFPNRTMRHVLYTSHTIKHVSEIHV